MDTLIQNPFKIERSDIGKDGFEALKKETKIVDAEGNPILMYNRSHSDFEQFESGKRNLPNKSGLNQFGHFFSNRIDLDHYGPFIKARYLNIKRPWDIRGLGHITEYKSFRAKLTELGISDKDLVGYDLGFQDLYMARNKKLGSPDGRSETGMNDTRMSTYNFFDVDNGAYLKRLLQRKGIDGVIFADEGELTAVAFEPEQIIEPKNVDLHSLN